MKTHILFDLDGTLTDPRLGIITCFQFALGQFNLPAPAQDELLWVIGPPIQQSFARLVPSATETEVRSLVEKYRERFSEVGMFENEVYCGIPDLLKSLANKRKYVATSKPHLFANKIISHFGLSDFFLRVYGSELNGQRSDKGDLIEFLLESEKISPKEAVIVGDRMHDIVGAKRAGISSIGTTWGYGSREELESAGADFIFDKPHELQKFLLQ
jgi:phosphoglycolate phosphatase